MDYGTLRAYTGNGQGLSMGSLRGLLNAEAVRVAEMDPERVLSYLRRMEVAAAIVMVRFRAEFSHLETRIRAGDGGDEPLYFDVLDRQNDRTPIAELANLTGGRTILLDVERLEMVGTEVFVRGVIEGRF